MFNLSDYEKAIRDGAVVASAPTEQVAKQFIYNLTVLQPKFDYFEDSINFRVLGQQWNNLSSDERNAQKDLLLARLNRTRNVRD